MKTEIAYFAAGCFWHPQEVFDDMKGVLSTEVGFMGGKLGVKSPSFKLVCGGNTGHAEVIKIEFNPDIITYEKLINKFWEIHNPTTLNSQGFDIGDQYRSAIFYTNNAQKRFAEKSLIKQQNKLDKKIVTLLSKADNFYKAEEYHQHFNKKRKRKMKTFLQNFGFNVGS